MAQPQTKDYTFVDDQGEELTITGPADATDQELQQALSYALSQPSTPAPEQATPQLTPSGSATVAEPTTAVPTVEPQAGDLQIGFDSMGDMAGDALKPITEADKRQLLTLVNSGADIPAISEFLTNRGIGAPSEEMIASIQEAREKGVPFGSVRQEDQFAGLINQEELDQQYQGEEGFFNAVGRSFVEAWEDPASMMNAIDRAGADFFNLYRDDIREAFPDVSDKKLDELEDQYIAQLARAKSDAAQGATANDSVVPWLIGQFAAIEPYDAIPLGRVGKAVGMAQDAVRGGAKTADISAIQAAGREGLIGGAVGAAGDVAGQALAIRDGAQDEFDPLRTAGSAALSGVLGGAASGIGTAIAKKFTTEFEAPEPTIFAPTAKKGSKQYRQEMGEAVQAIDRKIEEVTEGWEDQPNIVAFPNFTKLRGVPNEARGVYRSGGNIYINSEQALKYAEENNMSPDDVVTGLVFHEALGHKGLSKRFGEELDTVLDTIYDNATEGFRRKVDDWMAVNPTAYEGSRTRAIEEVLAETSEQLGPIQRTFVDRVKDKIKNFVRDMGFNWTISDREVLSILSMAQRQITDERPLEGPSANQSDRLDYTPSDTTSAGFRRRKPRDRDLLGIRKEYWAKKRAEAERTEALERGEIKPGEELGDRYSLKASDIPDDPADLDADTLFEIKNNYEVLLKMTEGRTATQVPLEDIARQATERGMKPSDILRLNERDPATFARKILMHDIAAEKMNTKLNQLYERIENGTADAYTRAEFQKTVFRFDDLTNRIFDYQGEVARATRAIAEATYTRKKLSTFREALKENGMLEESLGLELLDDPVAFDRFANEVMGQLKQTKTDGTKPTLGNEIAGWLNVPRAVMSSTDLSAPLRQGWYFMPHKEWWQAVPKMFEYFASQDRFDKLQRSISEDPNNLVMREAGIAFTDVEGSLQLREEAYQTDKAQKIPILGKAIKMSERAYVGFLNKLRMDLFNNMMAGYLKDGAVPDPETGKYKPDDYELDAVQQRALATWINAGTGRGSLHAPDLVYGRSKGPEEYSKRSALEASAPLLNGMFFSPKLLTSRVMLLNPTVYATLPPKVRGRAMANTVTMGLSYLTFVSAMNEMLQYALPEEDVDVEFDPRSSDFGKIRIGTQRWDVAGGFGQYITLGARLATGQRLSSTGKEYSYSSSDELEQAQEWIRTVLGMDNVTEPANLAMQSSVGGAVEDFLRNKLSPNASFVVDMAVGENAIGEPVDALSSAGQRMLPLAVQDTVDAFSTYDPTRAALSTIPIFFGVGYNDYLPASLDPEQTLKVSDNFKDEDIEDGETDLATAKDGVVRLKPEAHDFYKNSVNKYFTLTMDEVMRETDWNSLDKETKEELIKEAKAEARKNGKAELLTLLGVE